MKTPPPSDDDVSRKLDEVVGTRYHEARTISERIRLGWPKWILGAVFAVAAAALVYFVIESHRLPPDAAKAPPKPVQVRILPPERNPKKE